MESPGKVQVPDQRGIEAPSRNTRGGGGGIIKEREGFGRCAQKGGNEG